MEKKKTEKADLENKKGLFLQIGLVVTLVAVLAAFEWKTYDAIEVEAIKRAALVEEEEIIIQTEQNTPPPPPPPQQTITEIEIVDDEAEIENELEINAEIGQKEVVEEYVAPVVAEEAEAEETTIFQIVEEEPGFPGGDEARMKYLQDNIKYPAIARESGIQGNIYMTFVVERDGSITDIKVVRGIGGGCDEEAVRVVKAMPKWSAGKQRGKSVRVQFNMPIRFTLAG